MKTYRWRWLYVLAVAALVFALPVASAVAAQGTHIPRPYPPGFNPSVIPSGEPLAQKAASKALPFVDDMESGESGWTGTGYWRHVTNPENLAISGEINPRLVHLPDGGQLPAAYSGIGCWWYGEDSTGTFIGSDFRREQEDESGGTSRTANTGSLISPALDLTGVQNPRLSFWTWYEVEGVDVDRYDMMYVEVSTDGGANYGPAGLGKLNPANDVNGAHWRPYASRVEDGTGLGQAGQWIHVTFDLSNYTNNSDVRLRFRFNSVDELYNGFRGWLIDDVSLEGQATPQPPHITDLNPTVGLKSTMMGVLGSGFVNGAVVSLTGPQVLTHPPQTTALATVVVGEQMASATIPNLPVGMYNVRVKNPDNLESPEQVMFEVTQEPAPSITGILPGSGLDTEATPVSISGNNFLEGATAAIDDTIPLEEVAVVSSTLIRGKVPAGLAPGYRNVTVANPDSQFDRLIGGFLVIHHATLTINVIGQGETDPAAGEHTYDTGTVVPVTATPAEGWTFIHWLGDMGEVPYPAIYPSTYSDMTITAVFAPNLTISVTGEGTTDPQPGTFPVTDPSITINATPAEGWRFLNWTGDASGSDNPLTLAMDAPKSVQAVFIQEFTLTIEIVGDGTTDPVAGDHVYPALTQVMLSASPTIGWRFDHWEGNVNADGGVVMDSSKLVLAVFVNEPRLTVEVAGEGTTDPAVGTHTYPLRFQAPVNATPANGWRFDHWEGDLLSLNANDVVVMDVDKTIRAVFIQQVTLEMIASGHGTTAPSVGVHTYDVGTEVRVSALAEAVPGTAGYQFEEWSGDLDGNTNPTTIVMDGNKTVTATFTDAPAGKFSLSISVNGGGTTNPPVGTLLVDGPTVANPHPITNVDAIADQGWQFQSWNGDIPDPQNPHTNPVDIETNANKAIAATFYPTLNVSVNGQGTTEPAVGEHVEATGNTVPLDAMAASGWRFLQWEGDVTSTTANASVVMAAPKVVTAVFVQQFTLTVAKIGEGATDPMPGDYVYDAGSLVTVAATPAQGWRFDHWTSLSAPVGSDNPISVTVDATKDITAVFVQERTLTITVVGGGSTDPAAGLHVYDAGTSVTVTPTAEPGWRFQEWQGAATGSDVPANITVDADKTLTAVFVQQFALTIAVSGNGSTEPPAGVYVHDAGTQVSITPTSADGWSFDRWEGAVTGSEVPASVVVDADKTVTAVFVEKPQLAVDPTSFSVDYPAGAVAFNVRNVKTSGAAMPYIAAVILGSEWLTLDTGVEGMDAGTVRASYPDNTAHEPRTGVIRITAPNATNGPIDVTIVQAGAPYPPELTVVPRSQSVGAAAGSTTFGVSNTGGQDLVWTATLTSGQGWLSIADGASGTNTGVISVAFVANPSVGERSGQIEIVAPNAGGSPATATVFQAGRESDGIVEGMVTNSLTGAAIQGANVTLVASSLQITVTTNADGNYTFSQLTVPDPYELRFTAFGFEPGTMTGVYQTHNANIALDPVPVAKPGAPKAISGPRSVFVEWAPNPEFDVKGYNVYRSQVVGESDATPLGDPVKVNGTDPTDVYEGLIVGTQFQDTTVLPGVYYVYQIQAISGQDRPSDHSDPSYPPVKGQWLTIYFPEIYQNGTGLFLWQQAQGTLPNPEVIMPVSFDCAYEVSSGSMQLVTRIPQALFQVTTEDPNVDITVEPTGITAGMLFESFVTPGPDNTWEVLIASADIVGRSLYGNGALFYIKGKTIEDSGCGPLDLIPFIPGDYPGGPQNIGYPGQQGVKLYDDSSPLPKNIDLELKNGLLCTGGGCLHGDVNNDGVVNQEDASFILKLWTRKAQANECSMTAGDINLDGYVDSADSTLILRWLAGLSIAPPQAGTKAAENLSEVSFAAAALAKDDPEPPTVTVATVKATASTVEVPITLANAAPMAGFNMVVTFPSGNEGLGFTSAELGQAFASQGFLIEANFEEADGFGNVRIAVTSPGSSGKADETTLVTLNLTVGAGVASGKALPVNISAFSLSDQYGLAPKFTAPTAPETANGSVTKSGGSLTVNITPAEAAAAGAQWSIDGGTTWRASGDTAVGLLVGTYTVTFKNVAGWNKPIDIQVPIADGDAKTATGPYTRAVGSVLIVIEPEGARSAGAAWTVDSDATQHASGQTVGNLTVGTHVIHFVAATPTQGGCFSPGQTWVTPGDLNIDVTDGGTATQTVTYATEKKAFAASTSGNGDWMLMSLVAAALVAGGLRRSRRQTAP